MKTLSSLKSVVGVMAVLVAAFGCASSPEKKGEAVAGPMVVNPRAVNEHIQLNAYLQPKQPHHFLAEVQDFQAPVSEVRLKVQNAPIEVEMEKMGGTTWRGALSSDQIKKLAVSGKSLKFKANIEATNEVGQVAKAPEAIEFYIEAPEFKLQDSG